MAPAHAQYVGGQPPQNGSVDKGQPSSEPPAQVLGENFSQPANAVTPPIVKHGSSGFPLGEIAAAAAAIATLALLWFFFVWKRRRDEDDEDEVFPAPA
jgi:HAMP domain-containing protein